jgi:RND family efflux transporter MFP subunit
MLSRDMQAVIVASGSRIDPVTRSLRVKARLKGANESIRPGTSFQVRLDFKGRSFPRVREIAVLWSRDGASVWRIADGRAERVFVKIIRRDRGTILVDGPLKAGDAIVVEGVQGLRPGKAVKTAPADGEKPRPQS